MARKNRLISKIANSVTEDGTFSNEVLATDFSVRVDVYDSINALPIPVPQLGTQAFVPSAKRFYLSDGNGWYSVSAVNSTPIIQSITDGDGNLGPFALSDQGLSTTLTITVLDSDADPLSYSATTSAAFNNMGTLSQVSNTNVFTITPLSEDSATTTSGTITFTATDDVNIASSVQAFTLNFFFNANTINTLSIDETSETVNNLPASYVNSRGLAISPDETKIYYCAYTADTIVQGAITTPGDTTTLYWSTTITPAKSQTFLGGVAFKRDGTKMFYLDTNGDGTFMVRSYNLNTPWDITSYDTNSLQASTLLDCGENSYTWQIQIANDGTKLGTHNNVGYACVLSFGTPWDVTSLTFDGKAFINSSSLVGASFFGNGTGVISTQYGNPGATKFSKFTTAWDVNTADTGVVISGLTLKSNGVTGIAINDDATRLYYTTQSTGAIIGEVDLIKTLL